MKTLVLILSAITATCSLVVNPLKASLQQEKQWGQTLLNLIFNFIIKNPCFCHYQISYHYEAANDAYGGPLWNYLMNKNNQPVQT